MDSSIIKFTLDEDTGEEIVQIEGSAYQVIYGLYTLIESIAEANDTDMQELLDEMKTINKFINY